MSGRSSTGTIERMKERGRRGEEDRVEEEGERGTGRGEANSTEGERATE